MIPIVSAINIPGIMPPTKHRPVDAPTVTDKITIGKDGGIIGPNTDDAAVTAHEKSSS